MSFIYINGNMHKLVSFGPHSNGPIEGENRLIKPLKRNCSGFKNQQNFFNRIYQLVAQITKRFSKMENLINSKILKQQRLMENKKRSSKAENLSNSRMMKPTAFGGNP